MYRNLYQLISAACCHIAVTVNDELVSEGSGFSFLPSGQVLTAAHVVTGRMPIRQDDFSDPHQRILCKFPGRPQQEYKVLLCGFNIVMAEFNEILQIDIAVLAPALPNNNIVPYLAASTTPPQLGKLVFAAGYSDELSTPFGLDQLLPGGTASLNTASQSAHTGYLTDFGGPIIKRGVVGNTTRGIATYGPDARELHVDLFYIDNGIHSGASGGPICNVHGDAVGLITRRAVTSASQEASPGIFVPSGCTIGVSLQPLRALAEA